jgi:hypothetical protein
MREERVQALKDEPQVAHSRKGALLRREESPASRRMMSRVRIWTEGKVLAVLVLISPGFMGSSC